MPLSGCTLQRVDSIKTYADTGNLFCYRQFKAEVLSAIQMAYRDIGALELFRGNRPDIKSSFKGHVFKKNISIGQIRNELNLQMDEDDALTVRSSILQQQIVRAKVTAQVYARAALSKALLPGYCGEHAYLLFHALVAHGIDVNKLRCVEITAQRISDNSTANHVFVAYNDDDFVADMSPAEIKQVLLKRPEKIILMDIWGHQKAITLNEKTSVDLLDDIFKGMMATFEPNFYKNTLRATLDQPIHFEVLSD